MNEGFGIRIIQTSNLGTERDRIGRKRGRRGRGGGERKGEKGSEKDKFHILSGSELMIFS